MQKKFIDNEYDALDLDLLDFKLDNILNEFNIDPEFTLAPEAEATGAFGASEEEFLPEPELDYTLDEDYSAEDNYSAVDELPELDFDEAASYVEAPYYTDDVYNEPGYYSEDYPEADYADEDEYYEEPAVKNSKTNRTGLFGFFRSRRRGSSVSAMEDEARNIAQRLREEEDEEEDKLPEPEIDLYSYMDSKAYFEAQDEDYDEQPLEDEAYTEEDYEEVAEDVESYELEDDFTEEYTEEYTEEDFEQEFSGLPDLDDDEPHYYEEPEEYYHESGNYEYGVDMGSEPDYEEYEEDKHRSVYTPGGDDAIEIDSRFNLSGRKKKGRMVYGSSAVDLSADESYEHTQQSEYAPTQWTPDYDDPVTNTGEVEEPQRKKHKFLFGKKKKKAAKEAMDYDPYGGTAPADGERLDSFDDNDAEIIGKSVHNLLLLPWR